MSTTNQYQFTLDDNTRNYCENTLNETESSRQSGLATLKQWAIENPHLPIKMDDLSLLSFLRGCKFNIERTKLKLINYYQLRRDVPEWYKNRDPLLPEIEELVKLGIFIPLKKKFENKLVVIIRTAAHNPKLHKQDNVFKAGNMLLDLATKDDEFIQIYGIIAIFDMAGVTLGHATQLTPNIIKKAVTSWQCYPCRPKQLEFINAPVYINVVLSIFKSFMSEKLKSRIKVHYGGVNDLHNILPLEILPREYGGQDESLESLVNYWQEKLTLEREWFAETHN